MVIVLIGLWSKDNIPVRPDVNRTIASDCDSLVKEIISPKVEAAKAQLKNKEISDKQKLLKLKNSIWNKIISVNDFDNFNENEYFRWMEMYKDAKSDLTDVNPVSIEQKLALIEVINSRIFPKNTFIPNKFSDNIEKLSALKLRKLQTHLSNFDLTSKLSRDDLNNFASDFLIILKGPPSSLLDYFTNNKTQRMNERLMRIVQEDMLLKGLRGMVDRIPEKESYTRLEHYKHSVDNFFKLKIWKYLVVPYDLPWIDRVNIPDELLKKIMIDGLEAHDQELIVYLKKQNMIDHYERFRKVYKPMAFALGFYFYYEKINSKMSNKLEENHEEEKKKMLIEFENLATAIKESKEAVVKTDNQLKEEQLTRVIQLFKEKYHEAPNQAEYEEMKAKIFTN